MQFNRFLYKVLLLLVGRNFAVSLLYPASSSLGVSNRSYSIATCIVYTYIFLAIVLALPP